MNARVALLSPLVLLLPPLTSHAAHLPLPAPLVGLDTPDGQRRLLAATATADFFPLVDTFTTQQDQSFCAIASLVTVANALPLPAPPGGYTQDNVLGAEAKRLGVAHGGLTVDQLTALVRTLPIAATPTHAAASSVAAFRDAARRVLSTGDHFLLVNFLRSALGQEPKDGVAGKVAGHWSPLGAYDEKSDSLLLLDVNRTKYPPTWVPTQLLFDAMNTIDVDSGATRGFIEVAAAAAPAENQAKPPSSRLLAMVGGVAALLVLVGAAIGFLVGRRSGRRAAARA